MVQQLLGSASLGMYAAILPLSQAAQFLPMSLAAALAPLLAQRKQEGAAAYERELLRVFRLFGTLGLAAAACIALLAPWIVPLLYGPAYRDAVPVLMLHACSNFFVFQGVAQGLWVANEGATTIALAKTLVGAATAVGANLALLPRFGLLGAAFAAVLAQAMSAVLCNIVLAPRVGLMQLGLRPPPLKQQGP
jgi:PST family polysaccharide transporter